MVLGLLWLLVWPHFGFSLPQAGIGILKDGPAIRYPDRIGLLKHEIQVLTEGEYQVRFIQARGDWELAGVRAAARQLMGDPRVDMVIAMGVVGSAELARRKKLPKPVIAPFVIDGRLQDLPRKNGTSGVENLCYLEAFQSVERDMKRFQAIVGFDHLAVLVDELFLKLVPRLRFHARTLARLLEAKISLIPCGSRAEAILAGLPPQADAVFVTPLPRVSPAEFKRLCRGLIEKKLPAHSLRGKAELEAGLFSTHSPADAFPHLARRIALNAQSILLGTDAGELSIRFDHDARLTLNMATARAIGFSPDWWILTEAERIHEPKAPHSQRMRLETVIQKALDANRSLAASQKELAAGSQKVLSARSRLFPQLALEARYLEIDADRAKASLGAQSERSLSGAVSASQLLYSEKAWAAFESQGHLQNARRMDHEALKLDIILQAATGYIDLLRARTFERIQEENLRLTRANLDRAEVRETIGVASPAERYRWESRIATDRQSVIAARSQTEQARIRLNRVLHSPLEKQWIPETATLDDPLLIISDPRFFSYVDNPRDFAVFRDFMVQEGIDHAPELAGLDARIAAQKRAVRAAERQYWLPTVALQSELRHRFSRDGAGVSPPPLPMSISLPQADDTDWQVALQLSFPLYSGGEKQARLRREHFSLQALRLRRQAVSEQIRERIRLALFEAQKSYPAIRLSQEAARAAEKNLELVSDAYSRGVVSIIELLDAQNAALVAREVAANAVHDFLADLMQVNRAVGSFSLFLGPPARDRWFERVERFFRARLGKQGF